MFLRFLFYFFLFYLLYKLVFNLILPLYRTTRQVKSAFREMNAKMQQQTEGFQRPQASVDKDKTPNTAPGEYIDFEEVRD
ncbi:MAG: hypothetical protein ACXVMS_18385 [Flavisolibacter sp.]